jgi:hypothetical protein
MAVSQLLGQVQILPLRDRAESAPVSFEVVVEEMLIAKSRSPGKRKGCRRQSENRENEGSTASR